MGYPSTAPVEAWDAPLSNTGKWRLTLGIPWNSKQPIFNSNHLWLPGNGCFITTFWASIQKKLEKHISWMDYLKLCFNGCSVISNHFPCKDFESSNWNNHFKNRLALEFQVVILHTNIYVPGDAKGALLSPIVTVGGHDSPLKGSHFHQPKKGHQQNCQVYKHTHRIHVWYIYLHLP